MHKAWIQWREAHVLAQRIILILLEQRYSRGDNKRITPVSEAQRSPEKHVDWGDENTPTAPEFTETSCTDLEELDKDKLKRDALHVCMAQQLAQLHHSNFRFFPLKSFCGHFWSIRARHRFHLACKVSNTQRTLQFSMSCNDKLQNHKRWRQRTRNDCTHLKYNTQHSIVASLLSAEENSLSIRHLVQEPGVKSNKK